MMNVLEAARKILPYYNFYLLDGKWDNSKCFMKAVIDFEFAYKVKFSSTLHCEVYNIFN